MKKVTYLLTIIFAVALMSTSCCKDDPVVPSGPMTLSELEGEWISTQYEYDNVTYFNCADLENVATAHPDVVDGEVMLITVNFSTNDTYLSDKCGDYDESTIVLEYDMVNAKIVLKKSGIFLYKFNVLSYDRDAPETLVLQLTDKNVTLDIPDDGIYTLQK